MTLKKNQEGKRVVEVTVRTVAGCLVAGVGLLGATAYLARAAPGGASGERLAFSGVLTGESGNVPLRVEFLKKGKVCKAAPAMGTVQVGAGGAFQTDLVMGEECAGFFDGEEADYEVWVRDKKLESKAGVSRAAVSAVPYAKYADQVGVGDCPAEYVRDMKENRIVLCQRFVNGAVVDEMVKVGQGRGAFWVDRYEASIWKDREGSEQFKAGSADGWPVWPSGQWKDVVSRPAKAPMVALSKKGVEPARNVTWFQAVEACAGSGKELLSRKEWFLAVQGTPDPVAASAGADGSCVTGSDRPRTTGIADTAELTKKCESVWGVQDMIGSLWEWTDEWYAGVGDPNPTGAEGSFVQQDATPWPGTAGYGGDRTWNVRARVSGGSIAVNGMPAAALRGGAWYTGPGSGAFALYLNNGPSLWSPYVGFRCAVRR